MQVLVDLLEGVALALNEQVRNPLHPLVNKRHRLALIDLVGLNLV